MSSLAPAKEPRNKNVHSLVPHFDFELQAVKNEVTLVLDFNNLWILS